MTEPRSGVCEPRASSPWREPADFTVIGWTRGRFARALSAVLVVIVLSVPAHAQPSPWRLKPIGAWGGPVNHAQIEGDIAYIGSGQRLVILDISDESNPVEMGSINLIRAVHGFEVRGDYAYVATTGRPYRFSVVDVSDPTDPRLVWYPRSRDDRGDLNQPRDVHLYQNIAYVREMTDALFAYDISDPEAPALLGPGQEIRLEGRRPDELVIAGDLMYVANDELGFSIYDISGDPVNPQLLGSHAGSYDVMALDGQFAYLATPRIDVEYRIDVLDVNDPSSPTLVGQLEMDCPAGGCPNVPHGLDVQDGVLYFSLGEGGCIVIDATDPTNPVLLGEIALGNFAHGVRFGSTRDRAYLLDFDEGLIIADTTNLLKVQHMGTYHSPGYLEQMVKVGDLLYISDMYNGFTAVDVSNPRAPDVLGIYETSIATGSVQIPNLGIAHHADRVYLTVGRTLLEPDQRAGLEVIDVGDPANPVFLGDFRLPQNFDAHGLALSTDLLPDDGIVAHLGNRRRSGPAFLNNYDVTDPAAIVQIASLPTGDAFEAGKILRRDSQTDGHPITLTLNYDATPWIIDQSDPTQPAPDFHGGPGIGYWPYGDMDEQGGIWYIASGEFDIDTGGLHIWDATDPTAPFPIAYLPRPRYAVSVQGEHAYVAGNTPFATLDILDVSQPSDSVLVHRQRLSLFTQMLAEEPYVYAINGIGGSRSSTAVGLVVIESACAADFTGATNPNDPDYGVPNGIVDADDFFYFLDQFVAENADVADLTGSSNPNDPDYGVPNGVIDADDFFFYLDLFVLGCP